MNGGLSECTKCGFDPCVCKHRRIVQGKDVAETGIDVFTRVGRLKMRIIKWIWPDIQRLADALYEYWDKT